MDIGLSHNHIISISDDERRRHLYVAGKTGTGKSTLLQNFILDDFRNNRPFALIDPHGDLAETIADSAPPELTQNIVYFDPLDSHVIGFNPLQTVPSIHRATSAARIVSAFKHIWKDFFGPRMEYIMTNAVRLLLENPGTTLMDMPRLLTDGHFRRRLMRKCGDPYIRAFWENEFDKYPPKLQSEAIAPIQNKVGQFANNPILRDIIGQKSTIDIAKIMDGKFLICNLSKRMGEEPSHLLGALLVTAFSQAAEQRANMKEEDRKDFTLYVDEFQNFATSSFATVLSEARKYRLNLIVANQFLTQIPLELRDAVLGNVGTLIAFRVGSIDSPILSAELGIANRDTITSTPNFAAWVKLLRSGTPSSAEYVTTFLPKPDYQGRFHAVLSHTRANHARVRQTGG